MLRQFSRRNEQLALRRVGSRLNLLPDVSDQVLPNVRHFHDLLHPYRNQEEAN
jgi:hypothetical protein